MAKGDVISNLTGAVGAAGYLTYQPAAGIEVIMTAYTSSSATEDVRCGIYNGTIQMFSSANTLGETNIRVGINNTIYFRVQNNAGAAKTLGYSGIQVK